MVDINKEEIVKSYIKILKKEERHVGDKIKLLYDLDPNGPIYNYLLYNFFVNVEDDFIRRHCVVHMDDKHLKACMKRMPEWFE